MQKYPLVLDLETKHTFKEFSEPGQLGVTVAAVYNYADSKHHVFEEKELNQLFPLLENASYIVGYNINSFDLPVLQPYYPGKISQLAAFDLLDDIKNLIGHRLALNDLVGATLNKHKTGHGLQAINLYQEGRWDELKRYCLDDVLLTKELLDFGIRHREVYYLNDKGRVTIRVNWGRVMESNDGGSNVPLTLPF